MSAKPLPQKVRPPEKKHVCDICRKVYGSTERLQYHEAVVHNIIGFGNNGTF